MKTISLEQRHAIGFPMMINSSAAAFPVQRSLTRLLPDPNSAKYLQSSSDHHHQHRHSKKANSVLNRVNKITETVKGKLSMGARILQVGGLRKVNAKLFTQKEGEKLVKASQCYLSTTDGPMAGMLFISSHKVAFCSQRSIKVSSPSGEEIRIYYKVVIPLDKIQRVDQCENVKKPSQKYIEIVTVDNFDFWFLGFLNHQKAFKYLQQAISRA